MAQSSYVPIPPNKARSKTAPAATGERIDHKKKCPKQIVTPILPATSPGSMKQGEDTAQLPLVPGQSVVETLKTTKPKKDAAQDKSKKKRKKGFYNGKDDTASNDTASVQQTSAQMPSEADNKLPLKMIDSTPNDRSRIVMKRFIQATVSKGISGILQEFLDIKATSIPPAQLKKESFDKNPERNRYKDTYCIDESRVILKWPAENACDYIHANWTNAMPEMAKDVICTQGPTEKTIEDFWRMVWQEKCICIIMLCSVMEGGKKKCEQYWPLKPGEKMTCAGLEIVNKQTEKIANDCGYTHLLINGKGSDGGPRQHFVNHLLWSGWPDRGVPATSTGILRLIIRTQSLQPVVVHCSAGIGRTGTLVALESCLRVLDSGMELSVYNIVKTLRTKRYNACQTDLQYCYLHRAIMAFVISKNVCTPSEIVGFVEDYEKLLRLKATLEK